MKPLNKTELKSLLKYWQKALRLQDWNIQLIFLSEWHDDGNWGSCEVFADHKTGRITLSNGGNYQTCCVSKYDYEQTLVHELLHFSLDFLKKYDLKDDKTDSNLLEAHIELTSQALVKLRRNAI